MQNILFTPPTDKKILGERKTLTARFWKRKPPEVGDYVTASTGRKKETRFAVLKITGVYEWDGISVGSAESATGLQFNEIAFYEGFNSWVDFISAYHSLNAHNAHQPDRKHYFIKFEIAIGVL